MIIAIVLIMIIWCCNIMPVYMNIIATILLGIKLVWELLKVVAKMTEIGNMRD